ncbi:MAG: iron-containing alcohol dehydrogenase [Eubacteriaceae bacterium]|jgi:alcohol dehydrogenase|nr:iron-containing alcohol dehydrogenase [Eubacteriaceae bacterium]
MNNIFNFLSATDVRFGIGAVKQVGQACRDLSVKKVLVVSDPFMVSSGNVTKVTDVLDDEGIEYSVYSDFEASPSIEQVANASDLMKENGFEGIIGFGGGSSLDTGKAIAVLNSNDMPVEQYFGIDKVPNPVCPLIMIPTTAGTGSEVSNACILRNAETGVKGGICSRFLMADIAICDPEMTVSCPPALTAAVGMDAYTHCIEGYVSNNANILTRTFHREAIKLISSNLRKAVANGNDIEARYNMMLGSTYAGWAMAVASLGACHAMAYALEGKYHAPHGAANAALLPAVMRYNALGNLSLFKEIAVLMGENVSGLNDRDAAYKAVTAVQQMVDDIDIKGVSELGMTEDDIEDFAKKTMKNQTRLLNFNPRRLTEETCAAIYRDALGK